MQKISLVFLAPIGCLLLLMYQPSTSFQMLSGVSELLGPEPQLKNVTMMVALETYGAIFFSIGMLGLTMLSRKPTGVTKMLLGLSALLLLAGAGSNLFGDWVMHSAFQKLASSPEAIDSAEFSRSFQPARRLLLLGYSLVFVGTLGVAISDWKMTEKSRMLRSSIVVGSISFALVLISVYWAQRAIPLFATISESSVEPALIADSVKGAIRSEVLLQYAVSGFAVSTLLFVVRRRSGSLNT